MAYAILSALSMELDSSFPSAVETGAGDGRDEMEGAKLTLGIGARDRAAVGLIVSVGSRTALVLGKQSRSAQHLVD